MPGPDAARLAGRLRALREERAGLTQALLARALGAESRVAVATISSWESPHSPKIPPAERLRLYALFFCTDRSTDGTPHLIPEGKLTEAERSAFHSLQDELMGLREAARGSLPAAAGRTGFTWEFESGRVTVICPEAPKEEQSPLASEHDPNYTRLYRYADVDALVELWGHLRASNPEMRMVHRLPSEVVADNLSSHLVLLGGVAWNPLTRRALRTLHELPVSQIEVPDLATGEIFVADGREFRPQLEPVEDSEDIELVEDVALIARLANPYNHSRTITICNGIHSRGVLGAVRSLTDEAVRERNEAYLASRFPDGVFALLVRVSVVNGEAISPDFGIAENRLYEWPAKKAAE